ncbi:MAG: arylsulfatase [Acidobacteria bacterium]|nr:arylsulfatase [Acidobacteriota bacterium]
MLNLLQAAAVISTVGVILAPESAPAQNKRARPEFESRRPNILLIITDDQGYGDLGAHGNPKLRTPNLDRLAGESVAFQSFYVSPVCSPTRASLLTGRYNYRTGVVDTYLGRSLMHPDEVTLAEMLATAGYRTGIFGKWHLGDNYPMRAMDQGFQEALTLNGGGIGQPSDPPGGESYFDPILFGTGKPQETSGYVSDVITSAALSFIEKNRDRPFFTYLAFNAPHTPLEVPEKDHRTYQQMNLKREDFPSAGHPIPQNFDPETTARIYGMVENIDQNVGRLLQKLDELKLSEHTIVIFLTDNGPQQPRYNAGMFQRKGSTHEGGIRVPCFVRWAGKFAAGRKVDRVAAHIDVTPTLLEICAVTKPVGVKFDGVSLLRLLKGEPASWHERTLFFQWHRGDVPERYRAFAARSQTYKLVQPKGSGEGQTPMAWQPVFKLYDMMRDPLEMHDVAATQPEVVARMKRDYDEWFKDVTSGRDYASPSRILLGASQANPVRLTRQDWRGPQAGWTPRSLGHWEVDVTQLGMYEITARLNEIDKPAVVHFALGQVKMKQEVPSKATRVVFNNVRLPSGAGRLECAVEQTGVKTGVRDVEIKRIRY